MMQKMTWNFDISQAPRGARMIVGRNVKGRIIEFEQFAPAKIIATDGDIVTVSHWIPPKEGPPASPGRWNMFATGQEPLAWMPWPEPPKDE